MQTQEEDKNNFVGMNGEVPVLLFRTWDSDLSTAMWEPKFRKSGGKSYSKLLRTINKGNR